MKEKKWNFTNFQFIKRALAIPEYLINYRLYLEFSFNKWHIFATSKTKPYKLDVRKFLAKQEDTSIIEIGTGLGDIIHGIPNAIGIDISQSVLSAAKNKYPNIKVNLLDWKKPNFEKFLNELAINDPNQHLMIVAVNVLLPSEIEMLMEKIAGITSYKTRKILIDYISDSSNAFRYNWIPTNENLPINKKWISVPTRDRIRSLALINV